MSGKKADPLTKVRDSNHEDLCAGCKHGVPIAFSAALRREWACGKRIFTLTEKRFSGRVIVCAAHEPAENRST